MKIIAVGTIVLLSLLPCVSSKSANTSPNESIFVGTSPCADFVKPFLAIPAAENCDRIKWRLTLQDSGKYVLRREWGYHLDNRTYLAKGTTEIEGTWKAIKGETNTPVLVQLQNNKNNLAFALADQNVLHLLAANRSFAIGDGGASYTLSRDQKSSVLTNGGHGSVTEDNVNAETVFSGRSPCQEIAKDINRSVAADCFKLKWLLTLRRDPKTLAPTTYHLKGSLYRSENPDSEFPREGKWKVIRGTKTNPTAVVYQLDAAGHDGPISLLKADPDVLFFVGKDGNLLVGNEDFSYTLNRDLKDRRLPSY
jgi:NlpE N-terminal domain